MTLLVTGTAGFIGSCFVRQHFGCANTPAPSNPTATAISAKATEAIVSLDALTYAGNTRNLGAALHHPAHTFVHGCITNAALVAQLLHTHKPRAIVHFAAESHVDRSIADAGVFIQTNVVGTYTLLAQAQAYWQSLPKAKQAQFRFVHISTDEVYGSLGPADAPFTEQHPYQPNSPYSASKAASDHLVRAWHHTHGLPVLITHCSNNYGPFHFPEKFIPRLITQAINGQPLPIYGDGQHVRDWLHVHDHCHAVRLVLERGQVGHTYNIGARNEHSNLGVAHMLCSILDEIKPRADGQPHASAITRVEDRPGHDRRYAINPSKIEHELGWKPAMPWDDGLQATVEWCLEGSYYGEPG